MKYNGLIKGYGFKVKVSSIEKIEKEVEINDEDSWDENEGNKRVKKSKMKMKKKVGKSQF